MIQQCYNFEWCKTEADQTAFTVCDVCGTGSCYDCVERRDKKGQLMCQNCIEEAQQEEYNRRHVDHRRRVRVSEKNQEARG